MLKSILIGIICATFVPSFSMAAPSPASQSPKMSMTALMSWGNTESQGYLTAGASISDIDRDGMNDILLLNVVDPGLSLVPGIARAISARTGAEIYRLSGATSSEHYGESALSIGDVDNDGIDDFAIGAGGDFSSVFGKVYIYSASTGNVISQLIGQQLDDGFGNFLNRVGDINGNGVRDFAVSAPFSTGPCNQNQLGAVFVFDGKTLLPIRTYLSPNCFGTGQTQDNFGIKVADYGDYDRDGVPDITITAPNYDSAGQGPVPFTEGQVHLLSGRTGAALWTVTGGLNESMGFTLAVIPDVDGDALPELVTSTVGNGTATNPNIFMRSISSRSPHSYLFNRLSPRGINNISFGSDFDGDGIGDLVVSISSNLSANPPIPSDINIVNARSGSVLEVVEGLTDNTVSYESESLNLLQLHGNNTADFLITSSESTQGASMGVVRLVNIGFNSAEVGKSCGSAGLKLTSTFNQSTRSSKLRVTGARPNAVGYITLSIKPNLPTVLNAQCTIYGDPSQTVLVIPFTTNAQGIWEGGVTYNFPSPRPVPGRSLTNRHLIFQAIFQSGSGVEFSNGSVLRQ